ncbi:hypothetical protein GCM10007301_48890 [Azorhizobium oxalatiphilum]|uniref:PsiF repeat-containing protein n=1 Tax=Azorhizobium oxalatiphilum TaxID=980631 RepID=A0A917CBU0_9HYPH|nr:hypothetical protein GCM10007301_48890 [Azorhizobium oxalatiphilum]
MTSLTSPYCAILAPAAVLLLTAQPAEALDMQQIRQQCRAENPQGTRRGTNDMQVDACIQRKQAETAAQTPKTGQPTTRPQKTKSQ